MMMSLHRLKWTAALYVGAGLVGAMIAILAGLTVAYPMQVLSVALGFLMGAASGLWTRFGHVQRILKSARDGLSVLASDFDPGRGTLKH